MLEFHRYFDFKRSRQTPRRVVNPDHRPSLPSAHAMNVRLPCRSLSLTVFAFVALAAAATAQTAPAPTAPTGDTVQMNPFLVNTDADVGYQANSSLAGSRFNSALKDTPAAISVFTPEFMQDIGAVDLTEVMNYAVNSERFEDDDRSAQNGNAIISSYQSFRIRGINASQARNYFTWDIPTDPAMVERIEDSRGPNAVLFGIAQAGGLINENTKQALTGRAFAKASFMFADHDSWRATLDVNRPLIADKLALRLNLVGGQINDFRHYAFKAQRRGALTVTYNLSKNTQVRVEYEHGQVDDNQPKPYAIHDQVMPWLGAGRPTFTALPAVPQRTAAGIIQNSTAATAPRFTYIANSGQMFAERSQLETNGSGFVITDAKIADYSINVGGPGQDRSNRFNALSAFVEQRLSSTTFLQLAYNHQDEIFDRYDARGGDVNGLLGDPNQTLPTGAANPYAGRLMLESSWTKLNLRSNTDSGRATLSQEINARKWGSYRFAAMAEYDKAFTSTWVANEIWVDSATGAPAANATPENAANNVWRRNYATEHDWGTYYVPGPNRYTSLQNQKDPITGRTLSAKWVSANNGNSPAETFTNTKSFMVGGQARYFAGRVIVSGGLRRDDLNEFDVGRRRNPTTQEWEPARNPATADPTAQAASIRNVGRTDTIGIVYHITPKFSVFYDYSENISLPGRGSTMLPANGQPGNPLPVPEPRGIGKDAGFALELLDGRVSWRTTAYDTATKQQSTTSPAPVRSANTRILDALQAAGLISLTEHDFRNNVGGQGVFDWETKGIETQLVGNLTKNWRITGSYALTAAVETNKFLEWLAWNEVNKKFLADLQAAHPTVNIYNIATSARSIQDELGFILTGANALNDQTGGNGKGKLGNRRNKASVFTRYDLPFAQLKGAYIGGGIYTQSKMFVGLDPLKNKIYANSFWRADALAGYTVRGWRNHPLTFQLNVMNLFDKRKPLVTRYDAVTNAIPINNIVQPPTTWRFTTSVAF